MIFSAKNTSILAHLSIIFLIGFSVYFLRSFTFNFSTLDWDEVTYIIMGEGLRKGLIPFVDLWDIKPIGMYIIYALLNSIIGYSTETVRIATLLFTSASSILIYLQFSRFSRILGIFFANLFQIGFVILSSGLSGNTEVFFIFFQLLSIYFLFKKDPFYHFLGAFFIGFAFIIKYIIAFEIVSIFISFSFYHYHNNKYVLNWNFIRKILPLMGTIIPFLFISIIYFLFGHWSEYFETILITSSQYSINKSLWEKIQFLIIFFQSYIFLIPLVTFILLFGINIRSLSYKSILNKYSIIGFSWFLGACVGATWTGYEYEHYLLTLIPGYCILLGGILIPITRRIRSYRNFQNLLIVFTLLSFIIAFKNSNDLRISLKNLPDSPREISLDLKKKSVSSLFIASGMHTPYVILNIFPPVKYPQPYNYQSEQFAQKIGLDINELIGVVVNSNVDAIQFCDMENDIFSKKLYINIKASYSHFKDYFPNCSIYLSNKLNH